MGGPFISKKNNKKQTRVKVANFGACPTFFEIYGAQFIKVLNVHKHTGVLNLAGSTEMEALQQKKL